MPSKKPQVILRPETEDISAAWHSAARRTGARSFNAWACDVLTLAAAHVAQPREAHPYGKQESAR
jgi:hypothetical protein